MRKRLSRPCNTFRNSRFWTEIRFARENGPIGPVVVLATWPVLALMVIFAALIAGAVSQSMNEAMAFAVGLTVLPTVFGGIWAYYQFTVPIIVWHERGYSAFRGKRSLWHYVDSEKRAEFERSNVIAVWSDDWQVTNSSPCTCKEQHENGLLCLPAVRGHFQDGPGMDASGLFQDVDPWELRHLNGKRSRRTINVQAVRYGGGVTLSIILWFFVILF